MVHDNKVKGAATQPRWQMMVTIVPEASLRQAAFRYPCVIALSAACVDKFLADDRRSGHAGDGAIVSGRFLWR